MRCSTHSLSCALENQSLALVATGSLKLEYQSRICKTGHEGYDLIKLAMRIEVRDGLTLTLINLKMDEYWEEFGYGRFEWDGWYEDLERLSAKLEDMGLDQDQTDAAVVRLLEKVQFAFKGSGLYCDPCERYMQFLFGNIDLSEFSLYVCPDDGV